MAAEQTEKATPKRKEKARAQGQFVRSRELTSAIVLLAGSAALPAVAEHLAVDWKQVLQSGLDAGSRDMSANALSLLLQHNVASAMLPCAALLGSMALIATAVNVAQARGIVFRTEGILQPSRLAPWSNAKQLFSLQAGARLLKQLLPAVVVIALAWDLLSRHFLSPPLAIARIPDAFLAARTLLLDAGGVMLAWGALDYLVEWRALEGRLRMSRQELRDEHKETEGSPQIKRRIRQVQRAMRRSRIKADVARASVVVTNPTHYAVALEFSLETMAAPKVLTKGRDLLASQIKDEARWAGVPIVENPPLARSLYRHVEPGQSIPADLYAAVAEILAFLFSAELERRARKEKQA